MTMERNKIIYNGNTLIDLTSDTVTAETMVSGTTAHKADGTIAVGTLVVQKYYTGASEPSSSLGNNGDLYLKVV